MPSDRFVLTRRARLIARDTVVFAASGGGHFTLLHALAETVPTRRRRWVTVKGPRSEALQRGGEVVNTVATFDAEHLNLSNPLQGLALAFRLRPPVVVSTGAGVVLTFVLIAWLLGSRVVFVETMARVTAPSRTGKVLARIAALHVVQWPELQDGFPDAKLCRPLLLPARSTSCADGAGTFVSVGTHSEPFERILAAVEQARHAGILPDPCFAQVGPATSLSGLSNVADLPPDEFERRVVEAKYVVGHCGAGLVATALKAGRRPIVMARRAALGEHVDDHQFQLARKLAELGMIVHVEEEINAEAVRQAAAPLQVMGAFDGLPEIDALVGNYLAPFFDNACTDT